MFPGSFPFVPIEEDVTNTLVRVLGTTLKGTIQYNPYTPLHSSEKDFFFSTVALVESSVASELGSYSLCVRNWVMQKVCVDTGRPATWEYLDKNFAQHTGKPDDAYSQKIFAIASRFAKKQ